MTVASRVCVSTFRPARCRVLSLLALAWSLLCIAPARGDDPLRQYFHELRSRRLFSLAERYGLERLARTDLSEELRAQFSLELARTFTEHAFYAGGEEQADYWNRAEGLLNEYLQQQPKSVWKPALQLQRALVRAAEGEWLRWQAELIPYDASLKQRAAAALQTAIPQLRDVERALAAESRRPRPDESAPPRIPSVDVRRDLHTARYRLGMALLDLAEVQPAGAPERAASLMEAETVLAALARGYTGEEVTWNSQVDVARAARLAGEYDRALQLLVPLAPESPQWVLDRGVAERVRILIARADLARAQELLTVTLKGRRPLPGELGFLNVQVLAELWQIARTKEKPDDAQAIHEVIESQRTRLRTEVGGFWSYRCEVLLEQAYEARDLGPELASTIRQARALYQNGRTAESIAAYERAAAAAREAGKDDLAFDLRYTRGSILLDTQQFTEAAPAFAQLVTDFSGNPRAADASLLAAHALGQLYEAKPTQSRRAAYSAALGAHRQRFAGHATAGEATWMLAQFEERRRQTAAALKLYREIPAGHPRYSAAGIAMARCHETIIQRGREAGQPVDAWEGDAVQELVARLPTADPDAKLDLTQGEIALRLARILMRSEPAEYETADAWLARIFASATAPPTEPDATAEATRPPAANGWRPLRQAATRMRVVSLAGQGRHAEAAALLKTLSATSPDELLAILAGLSQLAADSEPGTQRSLGNLQLAAALELNEARAELSAEQRRQLDRCLAQAYAATGRNDRAVEVLEGLVQEMPADRQLREELAQRLMECGTSACLGRALVLWRKLEAQEKPGSLKWLEARYEVARCSLELKEFEQCQKLIGVTRLLYPALGNEALKARFAELEKECARRQRN